MIKRAKVGFFKIRHLANLTISSFSDILFAQLVSTELKGFKSIVKNLAWLAL